MSKDVMEIWDALTQGEKDELRKKTEARGAFISDGKKPYVLHLHSNKDEMYAEGKELGFRGDALHNFALIGYEVSLEIEVDEFGEAMLISVGGSKLAQEIEI